MAVDGGYDIHHTRRTQVGRSALGGYAVRRTLFAFRSDMTRDVGANKIQLSSNQ